jgi:polyhydroxyalkanoate synthesis repressor PhaR
LEDIARMIREGMDVQVLDAKTGKDITRVILTQIVVEDARDKESGLPLKLLRQLVVASDRATHDFLSWYLDNTMELYNKAQEAIHSRLSDAKRAVTSPLDYVRGMLSGLPWPPAHDDSEVERLRTQVEELKAELAELKAARKPAPRKTRVQ